ncbi:hypothetical protein SADUNF_Sadunf19G0029400 [Salix dunnii]|uniref:Uncharacterized protein n=1 Tax=Salix dunnii TaxID=1413687 RepID=A0A835J1N8_9ROSI|nr:hypothetical protein SADUNF_Sadunf19G0029400 [Salix dunnii]
MASSNLDITSNSTPIPFTFPTIHHLLSIKLDGSNYLGWLPQFLPYSMANRFAAQNRSCVSHLKRQLQNLQQENKTCADYVQIEKGLANQFAGAGKPIEDDDLIPYIIGGLRATYTPFITSFSFATRDISLSFNEFQSELLSYGTLLENQVKTVPLEARQFALFNQFQGSSKFSKKKKIDMVNSDILLTHSILLIFLIRSSHLGMTAPSTLILNLSLELRISLYQRCLTKIILHVRFVTSQTIKH